MQKILLCDDDPVNLADQTVWLQIELGIETIIPAKSLDEAVRLAEPVIGDIKIVFTDGDLGNNQYGWDLVEILRARGYKGKAAYTGFTEMPRDKRHLFDDVVGKRILQIREYALANFKKQ